ncbi:hypothetical protein T11_15054 [Trichinella zimbabwensis]|uniref:Uncharacterized protein n=1 Tax=Trichinella zimbabwensis TaxID=268475 RepID=A0A0V1I1N0_9BILA|nr:hypothetical protein T11_15054 [Trichinella zimbabwensis]
MKTISELDVLINCLKNVGKEQLTKKYVITYIVLPCGLVVRICGFHPQGPGSIPGMGKLFPLLTSQYV